MTATLPEKGSHNAIYLIDISSFIFRAYYSIGHLSMKDGTPTGAVFGVTNMLVKLLDEYAPSHIAAAMDSKTPTFRKEIFPEYKANRPPVPEDLKLQFPLIDELLVGFDLTILQKDRYEADDVIATAASVAKQAGFDVVIVSGDKDLMQLVGPGIVMLDTMKDKIWDAAAVQKKWGVLPNLLGDLLALAGDSSDNIPGVPRVGPKTAAPLLVEYGGLTELLAGRDTLKSKALAKRLTEHEEDAILSRRLVTLDESVPIEIDMEEMRYGSIDSTKLGKVLDRFEFQKLKERLFGVQEDESDEDQPNYRTVSDEQELRKIARAIREKGRFAVDLETTSVDAVRAEIVGMALAWELDSAVYVPIAHHEGPRLSLDTVLDIVKPLLTDPKIEVVAQNVKYEDTIFRRHGIHIKNVGFDPMLASYLIRVDGRSHKLDVLAREILGKKMISYNEVTEKSRGHQLTFDAVSVNRATEYSGEDALMALAVTDKMLPLVDEAGVGELLFDVEIPLARVLCSMELEGVAVNMELLGEMSRSFGVELGQLEENAYRIAGREFNLASPKQLQGILFDELGLPTQRKTKTGFSTDSEVLEILAPMHELPAHLLEHRVLSKLKGTYLDALPRLVNPATKRIHTSFNQAVAATGRLSSSNPNLQNIPIRSERGRDIRRAFVAAPGNLLISADYSQIELRVLAHLSGDSELTKAFLQGDDIHSRTARAIFGYGLDEEVPTEERVQAKAINFGVIYGKTEFSLAKELQIPRSEARRFIEEYFRLYSGVQQFMEDTIDLARTERGVSTLLGRKRVLRDIDSVNHNVRKQAERMARNTPIQGTAADLLKVAMIRVDRRLKREDSGAQMILTVHDELVFEVPEDEVLKTIPLIREEMEGAIHLKVPMIVDIGFGPNWAEAH
ncbi:MAG: DNA polymerase I [Proteobacteria bacterium]|nr:DNA polymerase I [Pseudomonadota bacterium]